jgi:hypothetical protein
MQVVKHTASEEEAMLRLVGATSASWASRSACGVRSSTFVPPTQSMHVKLAAAVAMAAMEREEAREDAREDAMLATLQGDFDKRAKVRQTREADSRLSRRQLKDPIPPVDGLSKASQVLQHASKRTLAERPTKAAPEAAGKATTSTPGPACCARPASSVVRSSSAADLNAVTPFAADRQQVAVALEQSPSVAPPRLAPEPPAPRSSTFMPLYLLPRKEVGSMSERTPSTTPKSTRTKAGQRVKGASSFTRSSSPSLRQTPPVTSATATTLESATAPAALTAVVAEETNVEASLAVSEVTAPATDQTTCPRPAKPKGRPKPSAKVATAHPVSSRDGSPSSFRIGRSTPPAARKNSTATKSADTIATSAPLPSAITLGSAEVDSRRADTASDSGSWRVETSSVFDGVVSRSVLADGGSRWKVATTKPLIVREGPKLDSVRKPDLTPGTEVVIFETAQLDDGTRRVRSDDGWLTAVSREGKQNLRPLDPNSLLPPIPQGDLALTPAAQAAQASPWIEPKQAASLRPIGVKRRAFLEARAANASSAAEMASLATSGATSETVAAVTTAAVEHVYQSKLRALPVSLVTTLRANYVLLVETFQALDANREDACAPISKLDFWKALKRAGLELQLAEVNRLWTVRALSSISLDTIPSSAPPGRSTNRPTW